MQHTHAFSNQIRVPGKRMLAGLACGIFLGMVLEIWVSGATGLGITGLALIGLGVGCCASRKR